MHQEETVRRIDDTLFYNIRAFQNAFYKVLNRQGAVFITKGRNNECECEERGLALNFATSEDVSSIMPKRTRGGFPVLSSVFLIGTPYPGRF